jgi:O-antigen ligase
MNIFQKSSHEFSLKALLLLSFFLVSIPFIATVSLVIFYVFMFLNGIISRKKINRLSFFSLFPIWGIMVIYFIALSYSPNLPYAFKYIGGSVALLLLPFVFWIGGKIDSETFSKSSLFFIYGSIASCLLSLTFAGIKFAETQNLSAFTYYELAESIYLHPTYFSLYLLIALVFLHEQRFLGFSVKIITATLFLFVLVLLQSRIALFGLIIVIFYSFLNTNSKSYRKLLIFGSIGILILGISSEGLQKRFHELVSFEPRLDNIGTFDENGINQRAWLWARGFEQIEKQPLFGYGLGAQRNVFKWQVEKELLENEFNYELISAGKILSDRNLHNQYLQFWYESGLFGLILFLTALITLFVVFYKRKEYGMLTVLLLFSIFLITENMLARQMGIYLYAFIFSFFLSKSVALSPLHPLKNITTKSV